MWPEKNGRTWRVREQIGTDKVTLAAGFDTKAAAEDAIAILRADALRGESLIPRGREMTLSDWIDLWWPTYSRALKETSRVSIDGVIGRYIRPMLGHLELGELEADTMLVQRWVNDLLDGRTLVRSPKALSTKTVRNAHGQLYVIMAMAIIAKRIRSNPCQHTQLPEEDPSEMRFLTYEEAEQVIHALDPYWRPMIAILLATGLRWSELMGLRARDIDRTNNRLMVRLNTVEIAGRFVDQTPKTKRSRRAVPFPERIGALFDPMLVGKKRDDRVVLGPKGGLIRHKEFYALWHAARDVAGLGEIRLHDLRHTHVAWLIAAGVQLSAISRRLGHQSVSFTDDRYGHLMPEVHDGVVMAVETMMAKIDLGGF